MPNNIGQINIEISVELIFHSEDIVDEPIARKNNCATEYKSCYLSVFIVCYPDEAITEK